MHFCLHQVSISVSNMKSIELSWFPTRNH